VSQTVWTDAASTKLDLRVTLGLRTRAAPLQPEVSALQSGIHFLPTLDGWRAIAALSVIISHWSLVQPGFLQSIGPPASKIWAGLGPGGVSLFFAISGYLITTRLLIEWENTRTISLRTFYIRRAFRILPPALVYLTVLGLLSMLGAIFVTKGELLGAAFFYNNYWQGNSMYTSHFWSLSLEEHFYLVWPVLIVWAGPRRALWVAAFAIVVTTIWRWWALPQTHLGAQTLQRTDFRIDALMYACLLAILLRQNSWRPRLMRLGTPLVFTAMLAILSATYTSLYFYPALEEVKIIIQSALLPCIIASTVLNSAGWFGRFLQWQPMAWIGQISYSLYVWHKLAVAPAAYFRDSALCYPVYIGLGLLLAIASYYLLERPLISVGRRAAAKLL
jgi:peptidoglycan/LPS O-acetylase OafA/YrhL